MIQIKQAQEVDYGEFYKTIKRYNLLEDWMIDFPEMAQASHQRRLYFNIIRRGKRIGWIWIDNFVAPEYPVNLNIILDKGERKQWVPGDMAWIRSVLEFCFFTLRASRIQVMIEDGRDKAEKFFKSLGFRFEGKMWEVMRRRNRNRDAAMMALTRTHYEHLKKENGNGNPSRLALFGSGSYDNAVRVPEEEPGPVHVPEHGGEPRSGSGSSQGIEEFIADIESTGDESSLRGEPSGIDG